MDISENGRQIAEKLSALLDERQQQELAEYMFSRVEQIKHTDECLCAAHHEFISVQYGDQPLTEIREGALYFCPELRKAPCDILEQHHDTELLYKGLAALPEKQRNRIYAHYFLGMSKTAIAKAEDINGSNVRKSIDHGLRNLEKFLKENF